MSYRPSYHNTVSPTRSWHAKFTSCEDSNKFGGKKTVKKFVIILKHRCYDFQRRLSFLRRKQVCKRKSTVNCAYYTYMSRRITRIWAFKKGSLSVSVNKKHSSRTSRLKSGQVKVIRNTLLDYKRLFRPVKMRCFLCL